MYGPTEAIVRTMFSFRGSVNNILKFQTLTAITAPAAQVHIPATKQTVYFNNAISVVTVNIALRPLRHQTARYIQDTNKFKI
jgi:hypothetical protein